MTSKIDVKFLTVQIWIEARSRCTSCSS